MTVPPVDRWYRGNTHTHTTNSDGDAPPERVVAWYAEHGYDFLSLTDHNVLTGRLDLPEQLSGVLLVPGEEITMALDVHVNALGLSQVIPPPQPPADLASAELRGWLLEQALAAAAAQGALAHVNHPNYQWALDGDTLAAIADVRFLEVFNGHPLVHNAGDAEHASTEALWDHLLGLGRRVYGLATDDAHHYRTYSPLYANPGRGWLRVGASALTQTALFEALEAGRFYASTGVALAECAVRGPVVSLCIAAQPGERYTIEFVGPRGQVVHAEEGIESHYRLGAGQPYVRARVSASGGARAWLQPQFAVP
jgi:hypothetical protein